MKLTIGNTHILKYEFKDSQNYPLPITTPTVKTYDATGLEITTTYTLTESQAGTWLLVLVTPNVTPFVTIELSVVYENQTHLTRDRYETVFIDLTVAGSEPIPVLTKGENTYLTLDEAKTKSSEQSKNYKESCDFASSCR